MSAPTIAPGLCYCGAFRTESHACQYTKGRGWCSACLADHGDPQCCTPDRLARIVRTRACGHRVEDGCGCAGLAEMADTDLVWIACAVEHAVGHRAGRSGTAACGERVEPVPTVAGHLRALFGGLCPRCWGGDSR